MTYDEFSHPIRYLVVEKYYDKCNELQIYECIVGLAIAKVGRILHSGGSRIWQTGDALGWQFLSNVSTGPTVFINLDY